MMVLLYGCGNPNQFGSKREKVSKFTDLLFEDAVFAPNRNFAWNMSREEFLSKVERADIFDPDSETFGEYRYYYSDETNITTFTPLMVYEIGGIGSSIPDLSDKDAAAFPYQYEWSLRDFPQGYMKQGVLKIRDKFWCRSRWGFLRRLIFQSITGLIPRSLLRGGSFCTMDYKRMAYRTDRTFCKRHVFSGTSEVSGAFVSLIF